MFKFYFLSPPHQVWETGWRDASCCWLDHHSWIHAFRRGGLVQRINWCLNSMSRRHRPSPNKHKGIIVATHACLMFFFTVFPPKKDKFIFALPCRKQQLALRCRSRGYCERMDTCVRGCHVSLGCQWAGFVRAWNCWEAQASFQGVGQSLDDPMHCYLKDIQFQMFSLTKVFPSRFSTFLSTNHQLF